MLARLVVLITLRNEAGQATLTVKRARRLERIFAVPYLTFALLFGLFSARAFVVALPETHVLIIA
ncbi:GGDEF domain-containing protein, partial [Altererythrobacter sp. KTW20L]|nr:GGDEF domain-containing protein [Altererythrobacter sp. KTW20L]